MTAAATTGPNNDPRPTSSTPATRSAPAAQARFSNFSVQRSFFNMRNFAADAEIPSAFARFDVDADLGTDADQHLRRRRDGKQERSEQIRLAIPSETKHLLFPRALESRSFAQFGMTRGGSVCEKLPHRGHESARGKFLKRKTLVIPRVL